MEWCRLYASLPDNPRVQAAEDRAEGAFGLLVQSICYATRVESRGFIPHTQIPRFGGSRLGERTKALAGQGIWVEVDGGYELDPSLWSEEKNLSDQAERKRKADRERMAAKRAAERARKEADSSRDSRATRRATRRATPSATGSATGLREEVSTGPQNGVIHRPGGDSREATCENAEKSRDMSRDCRGLEKRREEKNPPRPPATPLFPFALPDVQAEGEGGDPRTQDGGIAALAAELRALRPDWGTGSIERALQDPRTLERPWPLVRAAALIMAADRDSRHPGRLPNDGDWWAKARAQALPAPEPPHPAERCPTHQLDHAAGSECRGCAADRKAAS